VDENLYEARAKMTGWLIHDVTARKFTGRDRGGPYFHIHPRRTEIASTANWVAGC